MALDLTGTWLAVYGEVDGQMAPASYVSGIEITHHGDRFSIKVHGTIEHEGTYSVDDKVEPHQITFVYTKSSHFELHKPRIGIVQLTGDTYKNCLGPIGAKAPYGFNTTSTSNTVMTIHEKKGPAPAPVKTRAQLKSVQRDLMW